MKNKVVMSAHLTHIYKLENSSIGKDKPKNHPYNFTIIYTKEPHYLKVGDILRCDGFPFMSRPKPISEIEYNMDTDGLIIHRTRSIRENITHKPVQLPTSLWVLRPVENIDGHNTSNKKGSTRV